MLKQEIGCIQSGPFAPPVGPAGYDDADAGRTPPYRWGCTKGGCLAISESLETLQVSLRGWLANIFLTFWILIPCSIYIPCWFLLRIPNDMDNAEIQKQFSDYCFH